MKNKFKEFLKEQKLTRPYVRMFMMRKSEGDYNLVSDFLNEVDSDDYISGLYEWIKTEDGHKFWYEANLKWLKILSNETESK